LAKKKENKIKNQDSDLQTMNRLSLEKEVMRLRNAIRYHREQTLDNRCWLDDAKLYEVLPDEVLYDTTLPPKETFLHHCEHFWECRQGKTFKSVDELYQNWEKEKPY
jgi:hypothetical protein